MGRLTAPDARAISLGLLLSIERRCGALRQCNRLRPFQQVAVMQPLLRHRRGHIAMQKFLKEPIDGKLGHPLFVKTKRPAAMSPVTGATTHCALGRRSLAQFVNSATIAATLRTPSTVLPLLQNAVPAASSAPGGMRTSGSPGICRCGQRQAFTSTEIRFIRRMPFRLKGDTPQRTATRSLGSGE